MDKQVPSPVAIPVRPSGGRNLCLHRGRWPMAVEIGHIAPRTSPRLQTIDTWRLAPSGPHHTHLSTDAHTYSFLLTQVQFNTSHVTVLFSHQKKEEEEWLWSKDLLSYLEQKGRVQDIFCNYALSKYGEILPPGEGASFSLTELQYIQMLVYCILIGRFKYSVNWDKEMCFHSQAPSQRPSNVCRRVDPHIAGCRSAGTTGYIALTPSSSEPLECELP